MHLLCLSDAGRLGYSPLTGLLLLIPLVNLIVWAMWALRESPNERALRQLRSDALRSAAPQIEQALHAIER